MTQCTCGQPIDGATTDNWAFYVCSCRVIYIRAKDGVRVATAEEIAELRLANELATRRMQKRRMRHVYN